jgi:hypothetical protein
VAWAEIILYITRPDADRIRDWINAEESVAWIIEAGRSGRTYTWKAVDRLDSLHPQEYSIWHKTADRLTIPSGNLELEDEEVLDPYHGWSQLLERLDATYPWFGAHLPGPYTFRFKERGASAPDSLGRSGFAWAGDHYRIIGKPAHPEAKQWWERLKRFVRENSTPMPWPKGEENSQKRSYAFEDAYSQIRSGRPIDDNP